MVINSSGGPTQEDTLKRVYSYQPTAYWAGRFSSQLDRLAAEHPNETRTWRVETAVKSLNVNAYGEGAKDSLDVFYQLHTASGAYVLTGRQDFKEVFKKRVRGGVEW